MESYHTDLGLKLYPSIGELSAELIDRQILSLQMPVPVCLLEGGLLGQVVLLPVAQLWLYIPTRDLENPLLFSVVLIDEQI